MTIESGLPSEDSACAVHAEDEPQSLKNLKVSVLRYPTGSVINIKCDSRDLSVRLQDGMSVADSLIASAREDRRRAQHLLSTAQTMEAAAALS